MNYVCLLSENEFYYKNIDLGNGLHARLRALNRIEKNKNSYDLVFEEKENGENGFNVVTKNFWDSTTSLIRVALTQKNKAYHEGGAGWNLTKKDGTPLEITNDILSELPETIWNKLVKGFNELEKNISENLESAEKN